VVTNPHVGSIGIAISAVVSSAQQPRSEKRLRVPTGRPYQRSSEPTWRRFVPYHEIAGFCREASPVRRSRRTWQGARLGGHLRRQACTPRLSHHPFPPSLLTRPTITGACPSELEHILRALFRNQLQAAGLCKHVACCDESAPQKADIYERPH
jgi:hypothetical protein